MLINHLNGNFLRKHVLRSVTKINPFFCAFETKRSARFDVLGSQEARQFNQTEGTFYFVLGKTKEAFCWGRRHKLN